MAFIKSKKIVDVRVTKGTYDDYLLYSSRSYGIGISDKQRDYITKLFIVLDNEISITIEMSEDIQLMIIRKFLKEIDIKSVTLKLII